MVSAQLRLHLLSYSDIIAWVLGIGVAENCRKCGLLSPDDTRLLKQSFCCCVYQML